MARVHHEHGANRQAVITFAQSEYGQAGAGDGEYGGTVLQFRSGAALNIGQAVVVDANGEVVTSGTEADGVKFAGIVVGGVSTNMRILLGTAYVGTAACSAADQTVLVGTAGVFPAVADDTITRGARVGLAATAGQLDDAVTEYTVGVALTAGTNDAAFDVLLNGIQVELAA